VKPNASQLKRAIEKSSFDEMVRQEDQFARERGFPGPRQPHDQDLPLHLPALPLARPLDGNRLLSEKLPFVQGAGIARRVVDLLQTNAAAWLADFIVRWTGLNELAPLGVFAVLAAFLIVIHLGFASATALAAAMIPIVIAILKKLPPTAGVEVVGMTTLLQFVISFGFILPVNSPQGMVAFGTDTFSTREFFRTGLVLTVLAYGLTLLFAASYWRWLGYV
jgi:solute carrier family 13 (sodium-dependent dicarboxylate transporter), member 2/3/5